MSSAKERLFSIGHNELNTEMEARKTSIQDWGEYYSGTRPAPNDKHKYTKNFVFEYYLKMTN